MALKYAHITKSDPTFPWDLEAGFHSVQIQIGEMIAACKKEEVALVLSCSLFC